MLTPHYYRSQADTFLALAREETSAEVRSLFLELAEGCQMQAETASEWRRVTGAAHMPVA
jgi:hypothetical protein